ncbi:transposase [Sinomicrobium oceani]|uniref:transposase n=1 Tax=Sinomicrobium oceani TaxID=1150368 RepID=UPI00227D2FE6|nr:transposase [Sinomicrobium oceani]
MIPKAFGRRKHSSEFKVKVVLEALSERYTIQELGRKYDIHPTQITTWKTQFLKNATSVFDKPVKDAKTEAQEQEERYLKMIGQQKMEIDFLKKALS